LSGFSPNGEKVVFFVNGVELDASRVQFDEGKGTHTITGLTQAELDSLQFLHEGTNGPQTIYIQAWTNEVDADGVIIDSSDPVASSVIINITNKLPTSGDDKLLWDPDGPLIDGRGGTDTVQFRYGEDREVSGAQLAATLRNIEILDLSVSGAHQIVELSAEHVSAITDSNNELTIDGSAEDVVSLAGEWTQVGEGHYEAGGVTLYVTGATVTGAVAPLGEPLMLGGPQLLMAPPLSEPQGNDLVPETAGTLRAPDGGEAEPELFKADTEGGDEPVSAGAEAQDGDAMDGESDTSDDSDEGGSPTKDAGDDNGSEPANREAAEVQGNDGGDSLDADATVFDAGDDVAAMSDEAGDSDDDEDEAGTAGADATLSLAITASQDGDRIRLNLGVNPAEAAAVAVLVLTGLPAGSEVLAGSDAASAQTINGWTVTAQDGQLPSYIAVRPPQSWSGEENVIVQLQPVSGAPIMATFALVVAAESDDVPDALQQSVTGEDTVVEPTESAPPVAGGEVNSAHQEDVGSEPPQDSDGAVVEEENIGLSPNEETETDAPEVNKSVPETEDGASTDETIGLSDEEGESLFLMLDEEGGIVFDAPTPDRSDDVQDALAPAAPEADVGDTFGIPAGEDGSLGLDLFEADGDNLDAVLPLSEPSAHSEPTPHAGEVDNTSGYAPSTADVMREIGMEMPSEVM